MQNNNIYDLNSKSFIKKINKYKENIDFIISQKNTELIENNHYNFPYEDEDPPAWEQGETRIILERLFNTTLSINKNLFVKKKEIENIDKNHKIIYFYNNSSNIYCKYYSIEIYKIGNISNPYKKIWIDVDCLINELPYYLQINENGIILQNRNYRKISNLYEIDTTTEEYKKKQIEIMGKKCYYFYNSSNFPFTYGHKALIRYLDILKKLNNENLIKLSNLNQHSQELLKYCGLKN